MGAVVRQYQPADLNGLYEVCVRTGAAGGDARGLYADDRLLGDVYAAPYAAHAPDLAFVVSDGHRVLGYIVGVADTAAFVDWYRREWLPVFDARHPASSEDPREQRLLDSARDPERMLVPELADYPAHLHIDLLPELQGQGFGRRLVDTLRAALRGRGIPAVHVGMDPANGDARAFYDRLGFRELPSSTAEAPLLGMQTR